MAPCHLSFLERDEQPEAQDFLAEVALVQTGLEHGFVQMLEL